MITSGASAAAQIWGIDADVFSGLGQWAGALMSLAAVIVALSIAIRDGRQRDRDRRDDQAAQARTITAGIIWRDVQGQWPANLMTFPVAFVEVQNHGVNPVTDVAILDVRALVDSTVSDKWQIGAPAQEPHRGPAPYPLCSVLSGQDTTASYQLTFQTGETWSRPDQESEHSNAIVFAFTDVNGLRWKRTGNGTPERMIATPAKKSRWRFWGLSRRGSA